VRKLEQEYDVAAREEQPQPLPEGEIDTGKFMQELEDFLRRQQEGGSGESGGSGSSTDR
jgi:hypothetical protein